MSTLSILVLCIGGGLGAVLRYWITSLGSRIAPDIEFPLPTLFVNLTGSAALGLLFGIMNPDPTVPITSSTLLFFAVGFCGAYTTFSSFCTETIALVGRARHQATLYVLATLGGCIAAFGTPFLALQ